MDVTLIVASESAQSASVPAEEAVTRSEFMAFQDKIQSQNRRNDPFGGREGRRGGSVGSEHVLIDLPRVELEGLDAVDGGHGGHGGDRGESLILHLAKSVVALGEEEGCQKGPNEAVDNDVTGALRGRLTTKSGGGGGNKVWVRRRQRGPGVVEPPLAAERRIVSERGNNGSGGVCENKGNSFKPHDHLNILLEARRTLGKPVNKVFPVLQASIWKQIVKESPIYQEYLGGIRKTLACDVCHGLIAAGRNFSNCSSIRKACEFLLSKQLPSGGSGESNLSCQNKEIMEVFNKNCMISYSAYRNIALGEYQFHVLQASKRIHLLCRSDRSEIILSTYIVFAQEVNEMWADLGSLKTSGIR
ncbi:hypothetical protein Fmac_008177 [Flemingia macrophylla]|uniref:Uncharacterized protein n=1 Tax=Flemingia macrophylla TaxID=520843 RepID=A0ABD1MWP0_9FABA